MMTKGVVLGHYVSADGIKVDPTKIEVILNFPTPHIQTEVHSFLGCVGYYHRFIEKNSIIFVHSHALTGNLEFQWSDECDVAFADIKRLVSIAPVLRGPNWKSPFHISSDASDIAIVLSLDKNKTRNLILFILLAKMLLLPN